MGQGTIAMTSSAFSRSEGLFLGEGASERGVWGEKSSAFYTVYKPSTESGPSSFQSASQYSQHPLFHFKLVF